MQKIGNYPNRQKNQYILIFKRKITFLGANQNSSIPTFS